MTATEAQFDIEAVEWGEPKTIPTRNGPRRIREWQIEGEAFWAEWKRGELKAAGYSVFKKGGIWTLTEWRTVEGEQTEQSQVNARAIGEIGKQEEHAASYEPELTGPMLARFRRVEAIYKEIERETGEDYSYQLPSIKRLAVALAAYKGALDASDTGTGKTPVACAAAFILERQLLVVCPKSVLSPWRKMAKRFGVPIVAINYEKIREGNTTLADVSFAWVKKKVKGEMVDKRVVDKITWKVDKARYIIAFDECHKCKDYKTINCELAIAAIEQGYTVEGLSATAADNPLQMKFVSLLTGLVRSPKHFFGWMTQNGVRRGRFGMEFIGGREVLSQIHRSIFPARGTRLRIVELGDKFPETKIIVEAYDMDEASEEIQGIYREMHRELAELDERARKDKTINRATQALVARMRALQKTELLKVPTLCQMAEDGKEEGMSVIVAVNFTATLVAVASRLKTTSVIHGGQTGDQGEQNRQEIIARFNQDKQHDIVINIKAGGVGIDLHGTRTGRTRYSLICPTFSAQDLKQLFGRAHRAGGAYSIQKIIFAAGTDEETACDKVREKMGRIHQLNDGELAEALLF